MRAYGFELLLIFIVLVAAIVATVRTLRGSSDSRPRIDTSGYTTKEIRELAERAALADALLAQVIGADQVVPQLPAQLEQNIRAHLAAQPPQLPPRRT
jgi:alpha-D-ribose 1-methylphosphonate 5-triphosphate synthase subunit PhnG